MKRVSISVTVSVDVEVPDEIAGRGHELDVLDKLNIAVTGVDDSVKVCSGTVQIMYTDIFCVEGD